jgi:2C-methyl-D-erythritol 2,4-cyclodiphosphate synthase
VGFQALGYGTMHTIDIEFSNEKEAMIEVVSVGSFEAHHGLSEVVLGLVGVTDVAKVLMAASALEDTTILPLLEEAFSKLANAEFKVVLQRTTIMHQQQTLLAQCSAMVIFDSVTEKGNKGE